MECYWKNPFYTLKIECNELNAAIEKSKLF